jgi:hypothetical protein
VFQALSHLITETFYQTYASLRLINSFDYEKFDYRIYQWGHWALGNSYLYKYKPIIVSKSVGELIQITSDYALFSPVAKKRYCLTVITDDYSRYILSAKLTEIPDPKENIKLLESVFNAYGLPKSYYINYHCKETDKHLKDYGLSKTENLEFITDEEKLCLTSEFSKDRAYYTLRDSLVRECIDKNITDVSEAQKILNELVKRNNYNLINPISKEPPYLRFKDGNNVWRSIA